jgi:hypothetical protein
MKEEAINTNDNYYARSWLQDKRSTLRLQPVAFVESGELYGNPIEPKKDVDESKETELRETVEMGEETVVETSLTVQVETSHSSTARMGPAAEDCWTKEDKPDITKTASPNDSKPPLTSNLKSRSSARMAPADEAPSFNSDKLENKIPSPDDSTPPDTWNINNQTTLESPPESSSTTPPTAPLPPIQFLTTEENIVFTPRNARNHPSTPTLTNWEIHTDPVPMTSPSAPDWQKPTKKRSKGGHKRFQRFAGKNEGNVEFVPAVHELKMSRTAEDALADYLENVRGQEDYEGDERYIDTVLGTNSADKVAGETGDVVGAMGDMSLDEQPGRSKFVESRDISTSTLVNSTTVSWIPLSEFKTPLRHGSSEDIAPVALVTHSSESKANRLPPVVSRGNPDDDDTWILNRESSDSRSESSENESDAFDNGGDLLNEHVDPIWNNDSEHPRNKGKQKQIDSDDSDSDEDNDDEEDIEIDDDEEVEVDDEDPDFEDDDDDDALLEEDEQIIANMILDDYNLEDLSLSLSQNQYPPSTRFRKTSKSLIRQPNVPDLPSDDREIAAHLQSLFAADREKKKSRKQDREKARLAGLLGKKAATKSQGKKAKRAGRKEEMERIDELEGNLEFDIRKVNDEMRAFWDDDDATEYPPPPTQLLGLVADVV